MNGVVASIKPDDNGRVALTLDGSAAGLPRKLMISYSRTQHMVYAAVYATATPAGRPLSSAVGWLRHPKFGSNHFAIEYDRAEEHRLHIGSAFFHVTVEEAERIETTYRVIGVQRSGAPPP